MAVDSCLQVKRGAAKIVEGLSGSTDGINSLKPQAQPLTRVLFRLVSEPDAEVSRAALVALVNLSQDPSVATTLLEANAVARVMDYIREKTSPHAQLLVGGGGWGWMGSSRRPDVARASHAQRPTTVRLQQLPRLGRWLHDRPSLLVRPWDPVVPPLWLRCVQDAAAVCAQIMLLANITVEERGSRDMLQLDQDGLEGLHMWVPWAADPPGGERGWAPARARSCSCSGAPRARRVLRGSLPAGAGRRAIWLKGRAGWLCRAAGPCCSRCSWSVRSRWPRGTRTHSSTWRRC
jgi:hypothetical protein